jgi:hypothetical protein
VILLFDHRLLQNLQQRPGHLHAAPMGMLDARALPGGVKKVWKA